MQLFWRPCRRLGQRNAEASWRDNRFRQPSMRCQTESHASGADRAQSELRLPRNNHSLALVAVRQICRLTMTFQTEKQAFSVVGKDQPVFGVLVLTRRRVSVASATAAARRGTCNFARFGVWKRTGYSASWMRKDVQLLAAFPDDEDAVVGELGGYARSAKLQKVAVWSIRKPQFATTDKNEMMACRGFVAFDPVALDIHQVINAHLFYGPDMRRRRTLRVELDPCAFVRSRQ